MRLFQGLAQLPVQSLTILEGGPVGNRGVTYNSTIVPVYYILADPANVSLLTSPVDVADGCTMYQEIWIS